MPEPLTCPFCAATEYSEAGDCYLYPEPVALGPFTRWRIGCHRCFAAGPLADSPEAARHAWQAAQVRPGAEAFDPRP